MANFAIMALDSAGQRIHDGSMNNAANYHWMQDQMTLALGFVPQLPWACYAPDVVRHARGMSPLAMTSELVEMVRAWWHGALVLCGSSVSQRWGKLECDAQLDGAAPKAGQ